MHIQDMMNQCCVGVSKFASSAFSTMASGAQWMGRTIVAFGTGVANFAQKTLELAKPFFQSAKNFVVENRSSLLLLGVGATVGAAIACLVNRACANKAAESTASSASSMATTLASSTASAASTV